MKPQKTIACLCQRCGNEAEMTVKCEEVVPEKLSRATPPREQLKRSVVCTRCGSEADLIVDYAEA